MICSGSIWAVCVYICASSCLCLHSVDPVIPELCGGYSMLKRTIYSFFEKSKKSNSKLSTSIFGEKMTMSNDNEQATPRRATLTMKLKWTPRFIRFRRRLLDAQKTERICKVCLVLISYKKHVGLEIKRKPGEIGRDSREFCFKTG